MKNKIIFLHGFGSSGATKTADYLRAKLTDSDVISPDIPLDPEKAISMLNKLCYDVQPAVIIGTSMGAMYAQQLHGYRKILVNPAFHLSEIMRRSMGVNKFMHPRADGATEFVITEALCEGYERMEKTQFNGITAFDKKHTYAFFGTGDTLVNGYEEYLQYYANATQYPGEHALLQKWVKSYILPCVQQLLQEEEDTEHIDATKTYEMLHIISEGRKQGRMAYDELWKGCYCNYNDLSLQYPGLSAPMNIMREGFRLAVRTFVYDFEQMPYHSFTKYSYSIIKKKFKDAAKEKEYLKLVAKGRKMDPMRAMELLSDYYIDNCGVSLGHRTVAYDAGSEWLLQYLEKHPEDKRWNNRTCFMDVMPVINNRFTEEHCENYDICGLDAEKEYSLALSAAKEVDEETAIALCWGNYFVRLKLEEHHFFMLIKVVVAEDKTLDLTQRALFLSLKDAEKEMQKWTEQSRSHTLCFIIREIPREEIFFDELVPVMNYKEGVPYWEDCYFEEHVYMPSGMKRKQNLLVGDEVNYIHYDKELATLRKGSIVRLPNEEEPVVVVLDEEKRSEGICLEKSLEHSVKVPLRYVFNVNI